MSSRISSNSEAFASELLETLEDMFPSTTTIALIMFSHIIASIFTQHNERLNRILSFLPISLHRRVFIISLSI